jgi:hypothetical protein
MEKLAGEATDGAVAVTANTPAVMFALNGGAVAWPFVPVTAVAVVDPPKVPLGPDPGAVNVTVMPLRGFALESFTVAISRLANALPITALCGVPLVAVIEPEMLPEGAMVSVKLAVAVSAGVLESVTLNVKDVFVTAVEGVPVI